MGDEWTIFKIMYGFLKKNGGFAGIKRLVLMTLVFLTYANLYSEESPLTLSIYFDNDLFSDTDRDYTNGTKFSVISPDLPSIASYLDNSDYGVISRRAAKWLELLGERLDDGYRRLNLFNISGPSVESQYNIEMTLGQQMYTPDDIFEKDLITTDRPYSGWLYIGGSLHRKTENTLETLTVEIGVVGPLSLARETQDFVHDDLRSIPTAQGWDHQLKNELGINLLIERKERLFRKEIGVIGIDALCHYGVSLGNVLTFANFGAELRYGLNLPDDFGEALLGRSGNSNIRGIQANRDEHRDFLSCYLFTGIDGRGVLRNIFLDGNTFEDSHSVDKENWVGDLSMGISWLFNEKVKISYAQVFRTREYKGQDDEQSYGAINVSTHFDF